MKPGELITLNRQLCVKQPKSNPYRLKIGRPVSLREPEPRVRTLVGPSLRSGDGEAVGKRGRYGWFWVHVTSVVFSAVVGFAIVGVQRLDFRRAEYHLATQLRRQEEKVNKAERLNLELVAQMRRMTIGAPTVPDLAVQPASINRSVATGQRTVGRL